MAAGPLLDLSTLDLDRRVFTRDQIYAVLPHRFEFMQLDRIVHMDREKLLAVAVREVRADEFWVRGHIPGRPLLPGVLMIESAAQLAAFVAHEVLPDGPAFWGFGGVDGVKFRAAVEPPARMILILQGTEYRSRRCVADVQGWVNDRLAFEGRITGMPV
ncbi:MAG: beta-hydroxyacyl-ACP dehydratase [Phycisphaerae bacterium]|jgi:3-hydroxyacyl-[acyl-carrier-protein] dehydratase